MRRDLTTFEQTSLDETPNTHGETPVREVFISYAREDSDWAAEKARTLRQVGIRVFYDADSIRGGDNWPNTLRNAISNADRFILGWSANSSASDWVAKEIDEALHVRVRDGITCFILIDLLDSTPLPAKLYETQGEQLQIAREFRVPGAVLLGLASSFALWAMAQRGMFVGSLWPLVAGSLLVLGVILLYVYYASPQHLRRIRSRFENVGKYLFATTSQTLITNANVFLDRLYGGPVWSKRAIARTVIIAALAVTIPNIVATGWFLASGGELANHYLGILRFFKWGQITIVLVAPLALNAVADVISVGASRLLISSAARTHGISALLPLLLAIPIAAILASAPLVALTSVDQWPSISAWLADLVNMLIRGTSSLYNDVEIIVARVLFVSTAVSACLPLLVLLAIFVGVVVAIPGKGALFRVPGRVLLLISRDARGPLAIFYCCAAIVALSVALSIA